MSDDAATDEEEPQPESPKDDKVKNPYALTAEQQKGWDHQLARVKREAKEAGKRAALEELGIEDADELKEILAGHKDRLENETAEVDKLKRDNDKLTKQVEELKAQGKQRDLDERVKEALVDAGAPAKSAGRVRAMLPELEPTADRETIQDAVSDLKEEFPDLFTERATPAEEEEEEVHPRTGLPRRQRADATPPSDPGRQPRKPTPAGDLKKQASDILAKRHPELVKD